MILQQLFSPVTKRHVERQILATVPEHLFRIIQDVDCYSEFLPLCSYSKVDARHPNGSFEATLTVGLPPLFKETYKSEVSVYPNDLRIQTKSIQSQSIDALSSQWQLAPHTDGCRVAFQVEMTVSDPLIATTLDQVLQQVAKQQVQAFAQRCQQLPVPGELQK